MTSIIRLFALVPILAFVSGCDQQATLEKFAPPEEQKFAQQVIGELRAGRFEEIKSMLDASITTPNVTDTLQQMAGLIPPGTPRSVKLVGAQQSLSPGQRTTNITYEYEFPDRWLLINVAVLHANNQRTVVGFNVNPIATSLEEQFKFRLEDKTPIHYITGFLVVCLPLFTLYVLIVCIRSKIRGRKWLWIPFILIGIGQFSLNWATGEWQITPLSVQLFSASAFAPLTGS